MWQWIDRALLIPSDSQMLAMTEEQRQATIERGFKTTRNVAIAATAIGALTLAASLVDLFR